MLLITLSVCFGDRNNFRKIEGVSLYTVSSTINCESGALYQPPVLEELQI